MIKKCIVEVVLYSYSDQPYSLGSVIGFDEVPKLSLVKTQGEAARLAVTKNNSKIFKKKLEERMVKVDIVRAVQLGADLQFGEAEELVNDMLELIKETLESGEDVLVTGLGKFELRDKSPRPGRDPKSKRDYEISARRVVTFHPSNVWRNELNDQR